MFTARYIDGIPVERAQQRLTMSYRIDSRLTVGVEANPRANDFGPLVNWRAREETEVLPALIFGTSSDRIGSTEGRAVYGTLSKDLQRSTGLAIAPYAGVSYGEFESRWRPVGGLYIRWAERWSSTTLYDGVNLHNLLVRTVGDHYRLGAILVEQDGEYYVGLSFGLTFGKTPGVP